MLPEPLRPGLVAWGAEPTRKIVPDALPRLGQTLYGEKTIGNGGGAPLRLELARNEVEGVQLVFRAQRSAALELAVEDLIRADGTVFPPTAITWRQVGYVFTQRPAEYPVDFAGWWPDPLLPRSQLALRSRENQVAWLSLRTAAGTAPAAAAAPTPPGRKRRFPNEAFGPILNYLKNGCNRKSELLFLLY